MLSKIAMVSMAVVLASCSTQQVNHAGANRFHSRQQPSHQTTKIATGNDDHGKRHSKATKHHHYQQPSRPTPIPKPEAVAQSVCPPPSRVLSGVYHPYRLVVLNGCQRASGVVDRILTEEDGDLHIDVRLDSAYGNLINEVNQSERGGDLVVELMARDGGHLPQPPIGAHISLIGAWVMDNDHGWNELHPVWQETLSGVGHASGPQFGGSPADDGYDQAAEDCRTPSGQPCPGYAGAGSANGGTTAPGPGSGPEGDGNCTAGYSPCLPPASDYDCAGGSGDGPKYAQGPVTVSGSDPYGLDTDGDGVACE